MNLDNAKQIILEGQRTIGLKSSDAQKLSISQTSTFTVDGSDLQNEVSAMIPEDQAIDTSVISNDVHPTVSQVSSTIVPSGEGVSVAQEAVIPQPEVSTNIFDAPKEATIGEPSILQPERPEVVNNPVPQISVPDVALQAQNYNQPQPQMSESNNIFDSVNIYSEPVKEAVVVSQKAPEPTYQPQAVAEDNTFIQTPSDQIPLDTPQTFYEKQVDQDAQGGFTNDITMSGTGSVPNVNTDPVVIMLDEAIRTVNERSRVTESLDNENRILRDQNAQLRNENEVLKQQIIDLNNKILIAEAQRQAAEQTLAGARMAENGMVNNGASRVYQQQPVQAQQYYGQAA